MGNRLSRTVGTVIGTACSASSCTKYILNLVRSSVLLIVEFCRKYFRGGGNGSFALFATELPAWVCLRSTAGTWWPVLEYRVYPYVFTVSVIMVSRWTIHRASPGGLFISRPWLLTQWITESRILNLVYVLNLVQCMYILHVVDTSLEVRPCTQAYIQL